MKRKLLLFWAATGVAVLFIIAGSMMNVYAAGKKAEVEIPQRIIEPIAEEKTDVELPRISMGQREERIDEYYKNAVFVGDSIMYGFQKYTMKKQDTFLGELDILAAGSFSVHNSLWPVDDKSVHPLYQGTQKQIWETISLLNSDKVFLMLGMNDLNVGSVEDTCKLYGELIGKIKKLSPQAEINIMSMTYILNGKETGQLQNDNIRGYNEALQQMAEANGWGYVDIASALADENGDLAAQYCSDEFAHQKPEAYDVWVRVLRDYAGNKTDTAAN